MALVSKIKIDLLGKTDWKMHSQLQNANQNCCVSKSMCKNPKQNCKVSKSIYKMLQSLAFKPNALLIQCKQRAITQIKIKEL